MLLAEITSITEQSDKTAGFLASFAALFFPIKKSANIITKVRSTFIKQENLVARTRFSVLFFYAEVVFVYAAEGANEIFGEVLEFCAGLDIKFGRAFFFVVNPTAYFTYIFHDNFLLCNLYVYNKILKNQFSPF